MARLHPTKMILSFWRGGSATSIDRYR